MNKQKIYYFYSVERNHRPSMPQNMVMDNLGDPATHAVDPSIGYPNGWCNVYIGKSIAGRGSSRYDPYWSCDVRIEKHFSVRPEDVGGIISAFEKTHGVKCVTPFDVAQYIIPDDDQGSE